jgi:hypothetical protein
MNRKNVFFLFLVFFFLFMITGCMGDNKSAAEPKVKVDFYPGLQDIERANANANKYVWATKMKNSIIEDANWWLKKSDSFIREWIPELTPFRAIDCPEGHSWRYNWTWNKNSPDQVTCKTCNKTFHIKDFPEQDKDYLTNPISAARRWDNDPQIQRNIRGLVRYHKMNWVESSIHTLGLAYAFTGNVKYAQKAKVMLLRLAEVYDGWIVHNWTHMYPADKPMGYAGKSSGWKIYDAQLLKNAAITYNYIYSSGLLTDEDKRLIEDDLFRVGARLLTALPPESALTNGAPLLLTGTATLGRLLEDHRLIAYTVDGFDDILHEYFFEDGHWWEASPSYALMTLNTFYLIPDILHGYTDPSDYNGTDAFENLNLTEDPFIKKVFTALNDIIFPDGTLPAINDSHAGDRVSIALSEALYSWYGGQENLRNLIEAHGGDLRNKGSEYALFKRTPDIPLKLEEGSLQTKESHVAPDLGLGILRAGAGKEQTVLMMDFGPHGGGHGHRDKLNIIFWANGSELLTDLGYIHWDHPHMRWLQCSLSHNIVMVNMLEQNEASGELKTFATCPQVKLMRAQANAAYPNSDIYERTSLLVGEDETYAVDIFRVRGGSVHDWIIHSPNRKRDIKFQGVSPGTSGPSLQSTGVYTHLKDVRSDIAPGPWSLTWDLWKFRIDLLNQGEMTVYMGRAPGQREFSGSDKDAEVDVILGRRTGHDLSSQFISVLQSYKEGPFIEGLKLLPFSDDEKMRAGLRVKLEDRTDYILSVIPQDTHESYTIETELGRLDFSGELVLCSLNGDELVSLFLANGTKVEVAGLLLEGNGPIDMVWLKPLGPGEYIMEGQGDFKIKFPGSFTDVKLSKGDSLEPIQRSHDFIVLELSLTQGEQVKISLK